MGKTTRFGKNTRIKVVGGAVEMRFADPKISDFKRTLDEYGGKLDDFTPVFNQFGPYFLGSIQRNFKVEGRPVRWAALSQSTIRQRLRLGFGSGPILYRTGALARGFRWSAAKRSFKVWNTSPLFPYHQYGTRRGIPARPMVVLQARDRAEFTKIIRDHLKV